MLKCEIVDHSMVYTVQWKGMNAADFTDDAVAELRETCIEGLKEEVKSPMMKAMLNRMKEYGYDFVYRFFDEKNKELCTINISPKDV